MGWRHTAESRAKISAALRGRPKSMAHCLAMRRPRVDITRTIHDLRREKQERLNAMKVMAGCRRCGYAEHPAALAFHHLHDKVMNVGKAVTRGWSWERIMEEVEKCEVVCRNCHAILPLEREIHDEPVHQSAS